jgi:hypothetical protein
VKLFLELVLLFVIAVNIYLLTAAIGERSIELGILALAVIALAFSGLVDLNRSRDKN